MLSGVLDLVYQPWNYTGPAPYSQVVLFDLIRDMSVANAKNYEYTSRDGDVVGVLVDITLRADKVTNCSIVGVPNSWKMRNAFKKFHFKRLDMFRKAGVTKKEMGKYGQTIRPYADACHAANGSLNYNTGNAQPYFVSGTCPGREAPEPVGFTDAKYAGGDWDRTTLVAADPDPTVLIGTVQSADQWTIHICDEHDTSTAPWESVGMIQAYIHDREKVVTPDSTETIDGGNPLALLSSQTVTGGDVAEIAEDQEEEAPPYDILDTGDGIRKIEYGFLRIQPHTDGATANVALATLRNVFLPAGFCFLDFTETPVEMQSSNVEIMFDVRGVFEAKDWTE